MRPVSDAAGVRPHGHSRRSFITILLAGGVVACAAPRGTEAVPTIDASMPYGTDLGSEGTPRAGGVARIALDREPLSFDSLIEGANGAAASVYDSLMRLDRNGDPQPYLAESMTSPDGGLTWLLTLRPGVMFHDGTPLDAEAVIFNVQRHIDTETSSGHLYTERIRSMRADDERIVRFDMSEATGALPVAFALGWNQGNLGAIGSPTAIRKYGSDYRSNPVGAGPFRFVSWTPGNRIVLERNENYWQDGLPLLDGLEFRAVTDTKTIVLSVQNGDVDYMYGGYLDQLITGSQDPDLNVFYGPGGGAEYLYLNWAKPPFDDHRMREAVVRSIDPVALSRSQYQGAMVPADSIFPPDSPYYSADAGAQWPKYDLEKAKQLIESYRGDGGTVDFAIELPNSPTRILFGQFIQAQFAAAGINAALNFHDLANFSATVIARGDFQMSSTVTGPWSNPYPNVSVLLNSGGYRNYGKYNNPKMDELLDIATATTDTPQRIEAYKQIQLLANQDIAVCWYSRGYLNAIARKELRGVVRYPEGELWTATMWLDR
jgi:peptide/nickel transport system substrate-binding protein